MVARLTMRPLQPLNPQGSNTTRALPDSSLAKLSFVEASPEGSYKLDLSDPSERTIALQLCRIDMAAEGDLMKNIRLGLLTFKSCKAARWPERLPTAGLLECDFVRSKNAKAMPVMDAKKLESFEREFRKPSMSEMDKQDIVGSFAPYSYLYASQIARLLACFSVGAWSVGSEGVQGLGVPCLRRRLSLRDAAPHPLTTRCAGDTTVNAAAMLFCRCVDLEDGLLRILEALSPRDRHFFEVTLGWNVLFRGSNPTGHYELNLSLLPHRMLAQRLKDQAASEGDNVTWRNIMCGWE